MTPHGNSQDNRQCQEVTALLWLHLYGELSFDEEESVEQHLTECEECSLRLREEIDLHAHISASQPDLPAGLLTSCRQALSAQLRAESDTAGDRASHRGTSFWPWQAGSKWLRLPDFLTGTAMPVWKPAAAFALLALGFVAGRSAPAPRQAQSASAAAIATRVRAVEPGTDGRVRLVLEETRRSTVDGLPGDDRIRALLLSAAQDPADPGLRVDSMELLRRDSETMEVRRALMVALESDPNPGVRLKALDGLRPFAGDSDVRRSLAHVLLQDEHSGLRTQAVDLLIQNKARAIPRDRVGALQELMQREENGYIRLRTQRALREMNASVDTF
ncbi:MAG: zf-HC2 domain-containing protein [Bryobacteraceae bacterium]